ncbi:MAG TPA: membrane dipeptidase, partial [Rhizomicrobium sp.]|nr:membrane dipeptidase [Rhizomicrobium sp.]
MNRRQMALSLPAAALAAAMPAQVRAQTVSREAADLYRRAIVFDANLIPPGQITFPVPKKLLDMMRNSGITAMRDTIGSMEAGFEDTVDQIAFMQDLVARYSDLYFQVRTHDDFARAKREGRVGILFGFEHPTAFEEKLERIEIFRGLGVRVMQLTYYKASPFGMGTFGDVNAGLTPLGRKAVAKMNEQGVAIDISH